MNIFSLYFLLVNTQGIKFSNVFRMLNRLIMSDPEMYLLEINPLKMSISESISMKFPLIPAWQRRLHHHSWLYIHLVQSGIVWLQFFVGIPSKHFNEKRVINIPWTSAFWFIYISIKTVNIYSIELSLFPNFLFHPFLS